MIELSLLGTIELRKNGESSKTMLVQPRRMALIAYLAASHGAFQRRDRLLLLFWGEQPEARARASLRQALYFIRRTLGDEVFLSQGDDEVALNPAVVRSDISELERAIGEGRADDALRLYGGDLLADFNIDDAPEFERWLTERRRELRRRMTAVAWQLSDAALAEGRRDDAVRFARRASDFAEYSESDLRRAMQTMSSAGDRAAALDVYEQFCTRLAADLETAPEDETRDLANTFRLSLTATAVAGQAAHAALLPNATPVRSHRSGRRMLVLGATAITLIAAAIFATVTRTNAHAENTQPDRVAVMPFTIRSASSQTSYLREGAATLLGIGLDGAGRLRVVDPNAVLTASPATVDLGAGQRISAALGASQFVLGEIEAAGSELHITATIYDQLGHVRAHTSAAGSEAHLFELVDTIARKLAIGAVTDPAVRLANVAATSTQSLNAFKSFLAGETSIRAGHYRDAVAELQNAVAADSAFGLAYYRLSLAREWTDGELSSDSAAALAEHFASRLPDRDRKLLGARRAFVRRDLAEGERLAAEVLAVYPTDADAWAQLGEVLFHLGPNAGRSIEEARAPFLTVLRYRPNDLSARVHLTRIAAHNHDLAHVDEWSTRDAWLSDASEVGTFELAAMRAIMLNDQRARDTIAAVSRRANDQTLLAALWRLLVYAGTPDGAIALGLPNRPSDVLMNRGYIDGDVMQGHFAPITQKNEDLVWHHATLTALALAMPSAPSLPAVAQRSHDELRKLISAGRTGSSANAVLALRLLDARYPQMKALQQGLTSLSTTESTTLARIEEAYRTLSTDPAHALSAVAPERLDEPTLMANALYDLVASVRAEALHNLHRDTEAIAWLNSVGLNSPGIGAYVPLVMRRRAELRESSGAHESALRDWREFAELWKSADTELRRLVEAANQKR